MRPRNRTTAAAVAAVGRVWSGELVAAPEQPPGWWYSEWYRRQRRLRVQIREVLGRAGRPMTVHDLTLYVRTIDDREIDHALGTLFRTGTVTVTADTSARNGSAVPQYRLRQEDEL